MSWTAPFQDVLSAKYVRAFKLKSTSDATKTIAYFGCLEKIVGVDFDGPILPIGSAYNVKKK